MNWAKITHEAYDGKQTIEFCAGSDIHQYIDYIERLLVAAGFHADTVKCGFLSKADEIDTDCIEHQINQKEDEEEDEKDLHT